MFLFLLCFCMFSAALQYTYGEQSSMYFDKKFINQTITVTNVYKLVVVTSVIHCATFCEQDTECVSISYHSNGDCRVSRTGIAQTCDICENYAGSDVYARTCNNGGIMTTSGACTCYGGYIGQYCERIMRDCQEGETYYSGQEGIFLVKPVAASTSFPVVCSFNADFPKARLYIQRHLSSGSNFNRTWIEYQEGFGDLHGIAFNFWIGNTYLNYITTSENYTLVIEMAEASWTVIFQQEYSHFVVRDASSLFKLEVSGASVSTLSGYPTLGDSFSSLDGNFFSTYDSDNDGNTKDCAKLHGSGFWFGNLDGYGNCTFCQPNRVLIDSLYHKRDGVLYEVFWDKMGIWSAWHVQMWLERR